MVKVDDLARGRAPSVLHVVVGHGLPRYFLNTIESVRATVPRDRVLVIDNASPDASLRSALERNSGPGCNDQPGPALLE